MSTYLTCSGCRLVFSSERAFVSHRVGSFARARQNSQRRCLTVDELRAAGLVENAAKSRGERVVWSLAVRMESWDTHHGQISAARDIKYSHSSASTQAQEVA